MHEPRGIEFIYCSLYFVTKFDQGSQMQDWYQKIHTALFSQLLANKSLYLGNGVR